MANTDPRLNRTPYPLTLYLEGKEVEFRMTPFSDGDMTAMDNWVQSKYIETARRSLTAECSADERRETLALAMETALGLSFMSGIGAKMMGTVEGVSRLVWQSLRVEHPELLPEQVKAYMFSESNINESNRIWRELNVGGNKSKSDSVPGKPKRKRVQGKRQPRSKSTKR